MNESELARFLAKVDKADECWIWTGAVKETGYGALRFRGRTARPHRVAYEHFVGPIPDGHDICHRCDNRRCVNPSHLFTGTRADNMRDAKAKGRLVRDERRTAMVRGSSNGRSKLTEGDVRAILVAYHKGERTNVLARRFGVCVSNVQLIVAGKAWPSLDPFRENLAKLARLKAA